MQKEFHSEREMIAVLLSELMERADCLLTRGVESEDLYIARDNYFKHVFEQKARFASMRADPEALKQHTKDIDCAAELLLHEE
jgi:hypothetical protein